MQQLSVSPDCIRCLSLNGHADLLPDRMPLEREFFWLAHCTCPIQVALSMFYLKISDSNGLVCNTKGNTKDVSYLWILEVYIYLL